MFAAISKTATRRPLLLVAIALLTAAAGSICASGVTHELDSWGFDAHGSEQLRALDRYHDATGINPTASVVALVESDKPVTGPEGRRLASHARALLESDPDVARVFMPFGTGAARGLVSKDGRAAAVLAFLRPEAIGGDAPNRLMRQFAAAGEPGIALGGEAIRRKVIANTVEEDLAFAELIALPVLFLIGILVFRGLVASVVPLAVCAVTISVTFAIVRAADQAVDMSVYALNLITGLGLGLSIDYSLLVITRFREQLSIGDSVPDAVKTTVATSGRTVFYSAVTIAGSAAALMVFPQPYLYSIGFGCAVVAIVSACVALVALPAALVLLGHRIDAFPVGRRRDERSAELWNRWARAAMRRPLLVTAGVTLLVAVLAAPGLDTKFATADNKTLPAGYDARTVGLALEQRFDRSPLAAHTFALVEAPRTAGAQLDSYASQAESRGAAGSLTPPVYVGGGLWRVDGFFDAGPFSPEAQAGVSALRDAAGQREVLVAGVSAWYVDQKASISGYLPELLAIIGLVTFGVLFMMTGSVFLPVMTFVLNLATIAAVYGFVVWIFQNGRLEGLLDYTSQGSIELTQPVAFFALTFGLTTDYGVFLLSRIKELRNDGYANDDAVALGVARTGRVITAAALMLCVSVFMFALSRIGFIKATGVAVGLAVAFDATVMRALLMPALMRLAGDLNWWAPRPLLYLHRRWGWSEREGPTATAEAEPIANTAN